MVLPTNAPDSFRELPSVDRVHEALAYFYAKRWRKIVLTLVFKLCVHSKKQEHNLLKCFVYVTQLTHRVLEALREEPNTEREDGAFALVLQMLQLRAEKGKAASDRSTTMGNLIGKYFNQYHLTASDYYFSVTLRQGVYREVGRTLLIWGSTFLKMVSNPEEEGAQQHDLSEQRQGAIDQPVLPSLSDLYRPWRDYHNAYEAALRTPFPFGRNKGELLKAVGRRDLRWLLERLPAEEVIHETLLHLEILLGLREARSAEEVEQAALAEHPWWRIVKHERALREQRINTRTSDPRGDRVLLESLSEEEKERLYDELLDLREQRAQYAEVQQAVETILFKKPPRFPTVAAVAQLDDEVAQEQAHHDFWTTMDWFRDPFPSRPTKPLDEYTMDELEDLEATAVARMLRANSALELPRFQPLCFKRSMRPRNDGNYTAYGFLRDHTTGAYVLALALAGRESVYYAKKKQLPTGDDTFEGIDHFEPQVRENLEFFNFPMPFRPRQSASILLSSLQYDEQYYHQAHLQPLYDRIRATASHAQAIDETDHVGEDDQEGEDDQQEAGDRQGDAHDDERHAATGEQQEPAPKQLTRRRTKRAPIGSARITGTWTKDKRPVFYLHLPVPIYEAEPPPFPSTVLGIHEHDAGYSYAVISFTGEILETGDLDIEPSVLPHIGDTTYNPNYAQAGVIAIVELAKKHNAYIGIEETGQFRRVGTSRSRNRRFFGRPSKKIEAIAKYKTFQYGLLRPRMVWRVAPSRDCSQCGYRLDEGTSGIRRAYYAVCPTCEARQPLQRDDWGVQTCVQCGGMWRAHEAWIEREFVCARCNAAPLVARMNAAIAVAFKTIHSSVNYYARLRNAEPSDGSESTSTRAAPE